MGLAFFFPCLFSFSSILISQSDFLWSVNSLLYSILDTESNDRDDCKSISISFYDFIKSTSIWIDLAFTLLKQDFYWFLFANLLPIAYSLSRCTESELTLELLTFLLSYLYRSVDLNYSIFFYCDIILFYLSMLNILLVDSLIFLNS